MKKTKFLALALSALLLTITLVSCNNDTPPAGNENIENTENTQNNENNEETAAKAPESGISAYEWKHADNEVMLNIGGKDIDFATYRYYAMNIKPEYDKGDETYWNEETEEQFKADMVEQFKTVVAIEKLCEEKNIVISEEELLGITDFLDQFKSTYGEDVYNQQLDLSYLTKDVYVQANMYNLCLDYLYMDAADEEKIKEYANENYVHVKHVLVSTLDENDNELTGEAFDEKTKLANEITERARNGEDFDVLVKEYGEDPGMVATPEGYTFTYGMMVPEFEEMSFKLSEGEISDPVKTSYGYHIIKKLPIDFDALIDENNQTYWEIVSAIAASPVETEILAKADSFETVETDAFKNLAFSNIGVKK